MIVPRLLFDRSVLVQIKHPAFVPDLQNEEAARLVTRRVGRHGADG